MAHLLSTAFVVSTFRRLVLRDSRQAYDKCSAELRTPDGSLTAYVERLVDPSSDHNADGSEKPPYDPVDPQAKVEWRPVRIIESAGTLSLAFCQVYLRLLLDRDTEDSMAEDDHSNDASTVEILCDQVQQQEHVTQEVLVDIVEFLADDQVEQVRPILDAPSSFCALRRLIWGSDWHGRARTTDPSRRCSIRSSYFNHPRAPKRHHRPRLRPPKISAHHRDGLGSGTAVSLAGHDSSIG